MYQWIESIRIEDGRVQNLVWHQKRVAETFEKFAPFLEPFSLHAIVEKLNIPSEGVYKLRLLYNLREIVKLDISSYSMRTISKFHLVELPDISYSFKFEDRSSLNIEGPENTEPIILQRGLITDTSYSNLIFKNDEGWFTPTTYLLNGTMRQKLLFEGVIKEREIGGDDLSNYSHFKIINAMMPPGDSRLYDISFINI